MNPLSGTNAHEENAKCVSGKKLLLGHVYVCVSVSVWSVCVCVCGVNVCLCVCMIPFLTLGILRGNLHNVLNNSRPFLCHAYMCVESLMAKCNSMTNERTRKYRLYLNVENSRTCGGLDGLHVLQTFLSGSSGQSCSVDE